MDEDADVVVAEVKTDEVAGVQGDAVRCFNAQRGFGATDEEAGRCVAGRVDEGALDPAVVGFASESVSHFDGIFAHFGLHKVQG